MRTSAAIAAVLALLACQRGPPGPAKLDTRNDACAHCRMAVSAPRFAAQLVAPHEEPRFFDDLGCLRDWLKAHPERPRGTVAYVADHRTGAWVRAAAAAYARAPGVRDAHGVAPRRAPGHRLAGRRPRHRGRGSADGDRALRARGSAGRSAVTRRRRACAGGAPGEVGSA